MGYTHYWQTHEKTSERLPLITRDVRKIVKVALAQGIVLGDARGEEPKPEVSDTHITLNGLGAQSHETLYIGAGKLGFNFCKTAHKPYDVVVTAILALAAYRGVIEDVSSDGDAADWNAGVELARAATAKEIPNPLLEK